MIEIGADVIVLGLFVFGVVVFFFMTAFAIWRDR